MITIDYRDRKLIYEQLIDNIKDLILRGDLKKDDFLPSVRALARELGINPNTIQKAYAELERQGIIATLPGRGSSVLVSSLDVADAGRDALLEEITQLAKRASALGMTEKMFLSLAESGWRATEVHTGKETTI